VPTPNAIRRADRCPSGFTLVELMIVLVIIAILASLTLAGLAGVRQRAKIDKTRSTIRKLNEIILPQYESYLSRRVPVSGTTRTAVAKSRLTNRRALMVLEMPDRTADIPLSALPGFSAPVYRYGAARANGWAPSPGNDSAECLALTVLSGGFAPDSMEVFRNDEIMDTDGNGFPEFVDGWNKPIQFMRWAPGFSSDPSASPPKIYSPVQIRGPTAPHDPMDPMKIDPVGYALYPLIVSGGPDESVGLTENISIPWMTGLGLESPTSAGASIGSPLPNNDSYRDNITNHDLIKK
jgi:prepilin-type N-terminal cleavage/methylation domain-containing protein